MVAYFYLLCFVAYYFFGINGIITTRTDSGEFRHAIGNGHELTHITKGIPVMVHIQAADQYHLPLVFGFLAEGYDLLAKKLGFVQDNNFYVLWDIC